MACLNWAAAWGSPSNCMMGSASTARCCGLTVTHPVPTAATTTITIAICFFVMLFLVPSEIDPEAARIRLRVLDALRVEQRHVRDLEAYENATAQRHQDAAARTRHVEILSLQH